MAQSIATISAGTRSAYRALAALIAIDLIVFMDRAALAAVLRPIQERFTLNDTAGGALVAVFSVSYCATLPVVGWLSDRIARKYVLAVGVAIWSLTSLATGLAANWEQLLLARCLTGIGEATVAPIGPALIADCFPRAQRSRALAMLFAAIPIGTALGLGIGGQAATWLDWRWAFYLTGLLGMGASALALAIDEPERQPQDADAGNPVSLLRNASFLGVTLGMALLVFALVGFNVWAPSFLAKVHGMALDDAGTYLGTLVATTGIGGAAIGGWLGDRLCKGSPGALLTLVAAATLAAVPCMAAALWLTQPALIFLSLAIGLALLCATVGPLDSLLIAITGPNVRGAAFALNVLAIHLLGEVPAPPTVGAISDATGSLGQGLSVAVAALAVGGIVFALICHLVSPTIPGDAASEQTADGNVGSTRSA